MTIINFSAEKRCFRITYQSDLLNRTANCKFYSDSINEEPVLFFAKHGKNIKGKGEEKVVTHESPQKKLPKEFFIRVRLELSTFDSLAYLYKPREGLSMGGKVSPCIANIFVHIMEIDIIKKHIDLGSIISYH